MPPRIKPVPSIRRPSPPRDQDVEAFIAKADVQTSRRPDVQTSASAEEHSPPRRRTTVYFDPQTFRDIKVYCAAKELELSTTINQAVLQFLNTQDT